MAGRLRKRADIEKKGCLSNIVWKEASGGGCFSFARETDCLEMRAENKIEVMAILAAVC